MNNFLTPSVRIQVQNNFKISHRCLPRSLRSVEEMKHYNYSSSAEIQTLSSKNGLHIAGTLKIYVHNVDPEGSCNMLMLPHGCYSSARPTCCNRRCRFQRSVRKNHCAGATDRPMGKYGLVKEIQKLQAVFI